ncbi:MAG: FecR domain-containing protein [Myxococcota bacterium]
MRALIVIVLLCTAPLASASTARVVEAQGLVERVSADGAATSLTRGTTVRDGDLVRVGDGSQARLLVDDQAVIELGAGSQLRLQPTAREGSTSLRLLSGRLWARVSSLFDDDTVEVETANAVAGVRGTSFFAEVDGDATTVSVEAGSVEVASRAGQRALIGESERAVVTGAKLERAMLDRAAFETLRGRIASREPGDFFERDGFDRLRSAWRRTRDGDGGGLLEREGVRDALREAYRNRRDNPLDIDPALARRILERLRELRRRAATRQ